MSFALQRAKKLYRTFHQFDPEQIGSFAPSFEIPAYGYHVGEASEMLYTSDKLNPETGEDEGFVPYFHEHEGGVKLVLPDDSQGGQRIKVPKKIREATTLVKLGQCDGFFYIDEALVTHEAKATGKKPDWYAIPQGTALLVIQDRKKVLAMAWGGDLNVEWRGVVG